MSGQWITPHFGAGSATLVWLAFAAAMFTSLVLWAKAYDPNTMRPDRSEPAVRRARFRRIALVEIGTVVAVGLLVLISPGVSLADIGVRPVTGSRSAWLTTGYVLVLVFLGGFTRRRRTQGRRASQTRPLIDRRAVVARDGEHATVVVLAILVGVSEEVLYRGLFVAGAVGLLRVAPIGAIVVVAVLFGIAHSAQGIRTVIATGVAGALLGALYLSGQSLLLPIIVHVALDIVAFAVVPPSRATPSAPPALPQSG